MKTIVYSRGKKYYYVKEFACGYCNWISVTKFDEKPKLPTWPCHSYQYDGTYFRTAHPFNFWKIKSGESIEVEDDHELIKDYQGCGRHK